MGFVWWREKKSSLTASKVSLDSEMTAERRDCFHKSALLSLSLSRSLALSLSLSLSLSLLSLGACACHDVSTQRTNPNINTSISCSIVHFYYIQQPSGRGRMKLSESGFQKQAFPSEPSR